jgi:hypothetical protein
MSAVFRELSRQLFAQVQLLSIPGMGKSLRRNLPIDTNLSRLSQLKRKDLPLNTKRNLRDKTIASIAGRFMGSLFAFNWNLSKNTSANSKIDDLRMNF